jgi:hypothetical protein
VGKGVSVRVAAGVLVGARVDVSVDNSGVFVSNPPKKGSVAAGASVAGASVGAWVAAGAPPQEVTNKDKIKMPMIRRIIHAHFQTFHEYGRLIHLK